MTITDRGLLCGYDLKELQSRIQLPGVQPFYQRLYQATRTEAAADLSTDELPCRGWCHSLYFTPRVLEAGFIYALTGEAWAAAHVARQVAKLERVYADPPHSFTREIKDFHGKPSAYFSYVHTALAVQLCRPALDPALFARFLTLVRIRFLEDRGNPPYFFTHFNAAHNAIVTHTISAAITALVWGAESGHPLTDQVVEWGRDACEMHLRLGFDAQGAPFEGPMYSLVTLEWVFLYADLLRRHGGEDLFKSLPELAVLPHAFRNLQLPGDIGLIGFNDCRQLITQIRMPWLLLTDRHFNRPQDRLFWQQAYGLLFSRDAGPAQTDPAMKFSDKDADILAPGLLDLLWWDGQPSPLKPTDNPPLPLFIGQGCGVALMRTSPSPDAVCVQVQAQGRSHQILDHTHGDAGHFSIFAHGEYLAYDTGYFNMDETTHSVVLVDHQPPIKNAHSIYPAARFSAVVSRPGWIDYLRVDAAAAKGCIWADRHLLFLRGEEDEACLLMFDNINRDHASHAFQWQLQANLHCSIAVTGPDSACVSGQKARLDCRFFIPQPGDFPTAPHSLKLFTDAHPHRQVISGQAETNPRLVAENSGPGCLLLSVITPRRIGEPALEIIPEPAYRTFHVRIRHPHFEDQVLVAGDHRFIRIPGLKTASEIVVIRRRPGRPPEIWTPDQLPVRE
jgi:hypothetical protein